MPKAREPNGRAQRATTRTGQAAEIAQRRAETAFRNREEALSVVIAQPHRRDLPDTMRDEDGRRLTIDRSGPTAGHVLGRLYLSQQINRDQLVAGVKYAELALRHMRHVTGHLPKFPSQAINDTVKGLACTADMSDDDVFSLRRSFADAQRALADTNEWTACNSALMSVCVMDREVRGEAELGALRVGLNALHRLWR